MLKRTTSSELTEWAAFEKEYGALGPTYDREVLREIHLAIDRLTYIYVGAHTEKGKDNPLPEPKKLPGPSEFARPESDDDE